MTTPFKALLVEGTTGVGKSTLIDALIRRHVAAAKPRQARTLVHLAQSHTYGLLAPAEDAGTLTVADNLRHLDRIVSHLEWLHASVQEHSKPWCFVVIDTLHLTHCVRPGVVRWEDVAPFDQRLAAIGCKLLSLRVSPAALWDRAILPRINEQFLREYARKFGSTHEEIHRHFVAEQETLASLFEHSSMNKLLVDNEAAAGVVADQAFRFWTDAATPSQSAQQVTRTGTFDLPCSADAAFPLFTPEGERLWIKTWDPTPTFPDTIEFAPDTVFRQGEGDEDAIWTILTADTKNHRAEYVRVAPASHAGHIDVKVKALDAEHSRVTVRYTITTFADPAILEGFSEPAYAAKMQSWKAQITTYLSNR